MEKVTTENPRRFSRREVLRAALTVAAAVGVSKIIPAESKRSEKEVVAPKVTSLPTVGHDMVFIPSPPQPTREARENIVAEVKPLVVEEERNPQPAPKEISSEYNLLSPEAFTPYAGMGGPETAGEEILDYFPQSYSDASDSLKGLWSRAIDAKLRDKPQANTSLTVELATFPNKISFDYLLVTEGTKFFDIQEQEERILPCGSNVVVIGKIDGEENFLAIYQEPVNSCYYFAKVGEDVLKGQKELAASKNLVVEAFNPTLQNLKEIGTPDERKRLYEVKEGDSLDTIASHFGLPSWHCVYGKNIAILGTDLSGMTKGIKLNIPDKYQEKDLITLLDPQQSRLSLHEEPVVLSEGRYFPETGFFVKGAFLDFYQKWGEEVIGLPLCNQLDNQMAGGQQQVFEHLVLNYTVDDQFATIEGRPKKSDGVNKQIFVYLTGWTVYYRQVLNPGAVAINEYPKRGKFQIDNLFDDFYTKHGDQEILGFAVSPLIKKSDGTSEQWTTNARLEWRDGRVTLGNLGGEMASPLREGEQNKEAFTPKGLEININTALEMIKRRGREQEIEARTVALLMFWRDNGQSLTKEGAEHRDEVIFQNYAKDHERSFANVKAILALHEARYELNPVVEKVLSRMGEGCRLINRIIQGELSASFFKDNQYPSLPEDLHHLFVFGGTPPDSKPSMILGGGLGYKDFPLIWGRFDLYRGLGPHDEEDVLRGLMSGFHELIHSRIQSRSNIPPSPTDGEAEERVEKGIIPPENQENFLVHMTMCSLTAPVEELYGFEPGIDSRIIQVYRVLKKDGVENAYKEILRAAATDNANRLTDLYQKHQQEGDLSLGEMLSSNSLPDGVENYPIKSEFAQFVEEFKKDYQKYFL